MANHASHGSLVELKEPVLHRILEIYHSLIMEKECIMRWAHITYIGMPQYTEARHLAVHPAGDIFVGTNAGLFKSSDNGDSWAQVDGDIGDRAITALTSSENGSVFVAVSLSRDFFRSNDIGQTRTSLLRNISVRSTAGSVMAFIHTSMQLECIEQKFMPLSFWTNNFREYKIYSLGVSLFSNLD